SPPGGLPPAGLPQAAASTESARDISKSLHLWVRRIYGRSRSQTRNRLSRARAVCPSIEQHRKEMEPQPHDRDPEPAPTAGAHPSRCSPPSPQPAVDGFGRVLFGAIPNRLRLSAPPGSGGVSWGN